MRKRFTKQKLFGLTMLLVFVLNFAILATPRPAYAIPVEDFTLLTYFQSKDVAEQVNRKITDALINGSTVAVINLLTYMASRFAYDAAVWVASGGEGENPLFDPRPPGDYLRYAGATIANEVILGIQEDLGPFNVCEFPALLSLRFGIRSAFERPELSADFCGFDVVNDWDSFVQAASIDIPDPDERNQAILEAIGQGFDPTKNELSVGMTVLGETIVKANTDANSQLAQFIKDSGFQPVADFITGNVETPASMVEHQTKQAFEAQNEVGFNVGTALLSNSDALLQVGLYAGSVFTNTLLSELANQWYEGLFDDLLVDDDPFDELDVLATSRERAVERYASLTSFVPLDVSDFNLLAEFTSCPTSVRGTSAGLFNCVMDTSFASAVARAEAGDPLTVQEAIDEGYINGNWGLVPSANKGLNQDILCYKSAFCHSNLIKLRKARIISVGWELAAESTSNSESSPVTLQEVVDGFHDCNDENELDDDHPWCHLIDPNWVLEFPLAQCRTLGYGQFLEAPGTDTRAEECVDIQSCIAEDADGNCIGGYGYCTREKNSWRFRGEACPEQYASCLSFDSRIGEQVDFLQNTLNYGTCGEDNVGCLAYELDKEGVTVDEETTFDWPVIRNTDEVLDRDNAYQEVAYFNAQMEECDEDEAGCVELIERTEDLSLNVVYNPSFEWDADENDFPDGWFATSFRAVDFDTVTNQARSGEVAFSPSTTTVFQNSLELSQGQFYAFTVYAKQKDGAADTVTAELVMNEEDGTAADVAGTSVAGDCSINGATDGVTMSISPTGDTYERFECIFTSALFDDDTQVVHAEISFSSGDVWIDDVQVEQNESATVFHAGYSENQEDLDTVRIKVPPAYLGCDGSDDDPDECEDYAKVCSAQNEGCSLYTPTNGNPAVSGVVNELNECPSVCAGYDTFKQEPTRYDPFGEFPVYFIPSTAEECKAEEVGCDEFTNLDTETLEYYTYLRACVTEAQADTGFSSDNGATFYTWEGSDTQGFQLRTWALIESDMTIGSFTHPESGVEDSDPPSAPCTNWEAREEGVTCIDDDDGDLIPDSQSEDCDEHDDIFENPNCREFYDVNGEIHYRDWRETVTVNDLCATYRKTEVAGTDATEMEESCVESGGYWDTDTNTCLYYGYSEESDACEASANGCREYTGGRSANSRIAFSDTFEGDLTQWETFRPAEVDLSNESIATDGHSIKSTGPNIYTHFYDHGSECTDADGCDSGTGNLGGECTVLEGNQYCGELYKSVFEGKTYYLSFWAKGNGTIDVGFDTEAVRGSMGIDIPFAEDVLLTAGWEEFTFGPIDASLENDDYDFSVFEEGATSLMFHPDSASEIFIDNVVLREGEDSITIIRDSWNTPAVCDQTEDGTYSAQYHLGCQEYTDQNGDLAYLKSFARLCDEDQVGCQGLFRTEQSESVYGAIHNGTCSNADGNGDGVADVADSLTSCYMFTTSGGGSFKERSEKLCTIAPGDSSCKFAIDYSAPEFSLTGDASHLEFTIDTQKVAPDRDVYVVVTDDVTCGAGAEGCIEVGLPTYSADRSVVESWESKYFIDDPDEYENTLCEFKDRFCEEYTADDSTFYFKDPQSHVCEYKTDITIGGQKYDGWFREGTNNFCYGEGFCSEDEAISCSLDSDCSNYCQLSSNTCSLDGAACDSDVDCSEDENIGTCLIDDGDFVIGGDFSGIWRNGDTEYSGWVGICTSQYSGCSEFQDPLDFDDDEFYNEAEGERYFFIDDENLEATGNVSSIECNGQVSAELGCALFNDTSITTPKWNAGATYIASVHADEFFGDQPYSLVDPITCDDGRSESIITLIDGSKYDLCANRCRYRRDLLESATFDPQDPDLEDSTELYSWGSSCYVQEDCPDYLSDNGDWVTGNCNDRAPSYGGAGLGTTDAPRLEDDTNRVLKVSRARECSEWLFCDEKTEVWDEAIQGYREICTNVQLCNEYSVGGTNSFCSEPNFESSALILDKEFYARRDVSWYGEEYAGYSIPEIYPVQHLTQVNVAPPNGFCNMENENSSYQGDPCESDSDCGGESDACVDGADDDYTLAFNAGECNEDHRQECTVGYCENSGAPCADSDACGVGEGSCISGICYDVEEDSCVTDDDCGGGDVCLGGFCAQETGTCNLNYNCTAGNDDGDAIPASCFPSTAVKEGSCMRGLCVVTKDGLRIDGETQEPQLCRAHPEANSPWPNGVVELWQDYLQSTDTFDSPTEDSDYERGKIPYDVVNNYEEANLCGPGEECECNYKKLIGDSGEYYLANETSSTEHGDGLCVGGPVAGTPCDVGSDNQCEGPSGGTCEPVTQVDTLFGLEGYCIEEDTGRQIKGDQDLRACVTWFPVDQLEGSTDLFAKYENAGFNPGKEVTYCSAVYPYMTLYTSEAYAETDGDGDWKTGAYVGCIERDQEIGTVNSYEECVAHNSAIGCPPGFFLMGGRTHDSGSDDDDDTNFARVCRKGTEDEGDRDCPFVCVPENSVTPDGKSCSDGNALPFESGVWVDVGDVITRNSSGDSWTVTSLPPGTDYSYTDPITGETVDGNTRVRWYENNVEKFTTDVLNRLDCEATGVEYITEEVYSDGIYRHVGWMNERYKPTDKDGWYNYVQEFDVFLGCKVGVVVDDGELQNAAPYTDRLLNEHTDFDHLDTDAARTQYEQDTGVAPYGITINEDEIQYLGSTTNDASPPIVAACGDGTGKTNSEIEMNLPVNIDACGSNSPMPNGSDLDDPESRSVATVDFEWDHTGGDDGYIEDEWIVDEAMWEVGEILQQLFARSMRQWVYVQGHRLIGGNDGGDTKTWNASESFIDGAWSVAGLDGTPPTVWAVNNNQCYQNGLCREGSANKITVNNQNSGDIEVDGDYFSTSTRFFFAADKNQLQVRAVVIDWGDETGSQPQFSNRNYYKNHRGLQSGSTTESKCNICSSKPNQCEWGLNDDSCDENYYSSSNTYYCSSLNLLSYDVCTYDSETGKATNSPCVTPDRSSCVYQPRVHIRDQWGWCAGTCGDEEGCFDYDGDVDSFTSDDYCNYQLYPSDAFPDIDPWVYYDGQIILTP